MIRIKLHAPQVAELRISWVYTAISDTMRTGSNVHPCGISWVMYCWCVNLRLLLAHNLGIILMIDNKVVYTMENIHSFPNTHNKSTVVSLHTVIDINDVGSWRKKIDFQFRVNSHEYNNFQCSNSKLYIYIFIAKDSK